MKILRQISFVLLSAVAGSAAFADSDSSALDPVAVTSAVKASTGVMIRVPVDEQGRELAAGSELRVVSDAATSANVSSLPGIWSKGSDVSAAGSGDSSTDSDSSTCHWGWNNWRVNNWGWYNNGYYNNYYPTYYYGGYTYNYSAPYYYNYYRPFVYNNYYPAWGYRYYYYARGW